MHQRPYVAVKILTAHATRVQSRLADELGLLRRMRDLAGTSRNPGRAHVITLIESFELSSIQGSHLCLVHEAMGRFPKVNSLGLPLPLVKVVAKQLLLALDFLHCECRITHTGAFPYTPMGHVVGLNLSLTDLKPDNILIKLDNMESAIEVENESSIPMASNTTPSPELRSHAILSRPIRVSNSEELLNLIQTSELTIQLADFGTGESP
jgi:serine/threonine-protein kinase SRPK3